MIKVCQNPNCKMPFQSIRRTKHCSEVCAKIMARTYVRNYWREKARRREEIRLAKNARNTTHAQGTA